MIARRGGVIALMLGAALWGLIDWAGVLALLETLHLSQGRLGAALYITNGAVVLLLTRPPSWSRRG